MTTITLLCENTARGAGVLGEHGLAWWIETGTHRVLFDTGQGLAVRNNAEVLRVDLTEADAVVLSHGHFDHVGGLETVLPVARGARLYLHPCACEKKFSGANRAAGARCISVPFVETEAFRKGGRRVIMTREPTEVVPGIWTTGEIPRRNDFEDTGGPFFLDEALAQPDPLLDDQALFFTARDGIVVLLGCAHSGVVNTLMRVNELTGGKPIHTVMGGMHLENASTRRMAETMAALHRMDVRRLGPVHCTGWAAIAAFQREFPERCFQWAAGMRLSFEQENARAPRS